MRQNKKGRQRQALTGQVKPRVDQDHGTYSTTKACTEKAVTFEGVLHVPSSCPQEANMRTLGHLADLAGQRVFADFGTFVLQRLVRSTTRRIGHR
jgi:hypothetical protein